MYQEESIPSWQSLGGGKVGAKTGERNSGLHFAPAKAGVAH